VASDVAQTFLPKSKLQSRSVSVHPAGALVVRWTRKADMTRIIERKDGAALDRAGRARVATAWRPLHHWLAENDSDRAIRGRLHAAADELMYNDHDSSDLYHGSLLDFAAETVDRLTGDPTQHPLSRSDQDFMDESLRARHQAALRSRASTLSLIVLVLAAGLGAVLLFRANQDVNVGRLRSNGS
jgi:hypothetical protein